MCHPGLKHDKPPAETHWSRWPLLAINWDPASSNLSAAHGLWYGCSGRLNIDVVWDPAHGAWNDVRLAAKGVSLYSWLLGLLLVWNLPHGPWQDDLRSSQVRQMLEDSSDEACSAPSPLLQTWH